LALSPRLRFEKNSVKILLEEYQATWVDAFLAERDIIGSTLSDLNPLIEHIGSTSIPGLCAKPTIDVLVGLQDDSLLDRTITPMIRRGYSYFAKYEPAMPYRRLFARLKPLAGKAPPAVVAVNDAFVRGEEFVSVANIHVLVRDTPHWHRHLAFRDFLRVHAEPRDEYGRLKMELSRHEFKKTNDYNSAKDDFIKRTQSQALAWYNDQKRLGETA
jgi:GrpB-like predicted nucleotidyltransferase (UPF0157 family)